MAGADFALAGIVEGVNFGLNIVASEGLLGEGAKGSATTELFEAFDTIRATVEDPGGTFDAVQTAIVDTTSRAASGEKKAIAQTVAAVTSVAFAGKPNANLGAAAGNTARAVGNAAKVTGVAVQKAAQRVGTAAKNAVRALEPSDGFKTPGFLESILPQVKLSVLPEGKKFAKSAEDRAIEIHKAVPEATQRRTTIAITETAEGTRIVSSSEKRLRKAQRAQLEPGEIEGVGLGHAEETGINFAKQNKFTPTGVGASRPICKRNCQPILLKEDVKPLSPLQK